MEMSVQDAEVLEKLLLMLTKTTQKMATIFSLPMAREAARAAEDALKMVRRRKAETAIRSGTPRQSP